jgi:hypothetical protein
VMLQCGAAVADKSQLRAVVATVAMVR